jgi:anti-sigma factor RsiW
MSGNELHGCESVRELLSLAAAGVLDAGEQRQVDQHVAACEACRREMEGWQRYARELTRLPAPVVPAHLTERTRALMLQQRAAAADRRWDDVAMAVLALFGWTMALLSWVMVRLFANGLLSLFESGFMKILVWSAASTLLAWLTAGVAAMVLGSQRRAARRMI